MNRLLLATLLVLSAGGCAQDHADPMVEWPMVGADWANSKYSALRDIDRSNVEQLEIAWEWRPDEQPIPEFKTRPGNFEATPVMVDGVLYLSTMYARAVALDAETGEELWAFDPESWRYGHHGGGPGGFKNRGLAVKGRGKDLRIYLGSRVDLWALDADGNPVASFGDNGKVRLTEDFPHPVTNEMFDQTSPPLVFEDLVIVGSRIPDRVQRKFETPGAVQAFDTNTGERRWIFYTIPQSSDAYGADTWEDDSWEYTGHANVWTLMSLDAERGLLYLPTSTPGGDYWGGRRLGANLFAESLVCVDVRTGKRKWHFQAVHHGLWDYDFPAAPNLVTINVDGRTIDAVAQVSKQGFTYVFDRVSGEPVWPIEERAVSTESDVPGERPHPTQPFPTKPPPFSGQGISLDDANDLTPEVNRLAREEMATYRLGPLFTPPSLRGTLQRPRVDGGANWGGAAFDPAAGLLFVRSNEGATANQVCENHGQNPDIDVAFTNDCPRGAAAAIFHDRPGGAKLERSRLGPIPLTKPPYSKLTAIDLNSGEIAWSVAFGEGSALLRKHPLLKDADLPDRLGTRAVSGPIVTAGGLVFLGGGEPFLYAFDAEDGREVTRIATEFRTSGSPMTYRSRSGRQFIVVATGAGPDASLVALALPKSAEN